MEKELSFFVFCKFKCCIYLNNGKKVKEDFQQEFCTPDENDFKKEELRDYFRDFLLSKFEKKYNNISKIKYAVELLVFNNRNLEYTTMYKNHTIKVKGEVSKVSLML